MAITQQTLPSANVGTVQKCEKYKAANCSYALRFGSVQVMLGGALRDVMAKVRQILATAKRREAQEKRRRSAIFSREPHLPKEHYGQFSESCKIRHLQSLDGDDDGDDDDDDDDDDDGDGDDVMTIMTTTTATTTMMMITAPVLKDNDDDDDGPTS